MHPQPSVPESAGTLLAAGALLEAGCLVVDPAAPVTFVSGLRSPLYVDCRRLLSHPRAWREVIEACAARIGREAIGAQVVSGVETAGIPHSSALAFHLGLPSVFVRKQAKAHGLGRRVEGGDVSGRHVLLVEDMITTGQSSLSAVEALRNAGARVEDCLAIVSYGFEETAARFEAAGVHLGVLVGVDALVRAAREAGQVSEQEATIVLDWLADPHAWDER